MQREMLMKAKNLVKMAGINPKEHRAACTKIKDLYIRMNESQDDSLQNQIETVLEKL